MNIVISSRHMDVTPAMKEFAEHKVAKLTKYFDRIQEIQVIFDKGKDDMKVEILVNAEFKHEFVAHHSHVDAYACVDGCVDKMERQLTDFKDKLRNRKHPEGGSSRHV